MKHGSTFFLRGIVLLMGLTVLTLCIFALPVGRGDEGDGRYGPIFWGMYVTTVPFFIALYQTLKLLDYIDKNQAFSRLSIKALRYIKYCALVVSTMYVAGMPYIYLVAQSDDAPGVVLIGLVFTFASMAIAVFAAVLQKLLQNAIDIKSENDLTV